MSDWGEESFIHYLSSLFLARGNIHGIGDDCAAIPDGHGASWLMTTDALVEGIHFIKEQITPEELGYKTIAVSVSDIAAMGGEARYALLSIALPNNTEMIWLTRAMEGVKEACDKWKLQLIGGDTVGSLRDLFINATLIGSAPLSSLKWRSSAIAGDIICVTGTLGDSAGGLRALQEGLPKTASTLSLLTAHFRPKIYAEEGKWLGTQKSVHAMMDLSDGLLRDLPRLMACSGLGAYIDAARLPLSLPLVEVSTERGWDPSLMAMTGGEDYCLILTVSPDSFEELRNSFQRLFATSLHIIGEMTVGKELSLRHIDGSLADQLPTGFDHFGQKG